MARTEKPWLIAKRENYIVLAFPMKYFNLDAPETHEYGGITYKRGPMEAIPQHLASDVCSCRRYNKETQ